MDLDVGGVLVEQLARDALLGDAHARDKILELVVPKQFEVARVDHHDPHLEAQDERQRKLMKLLRDSDAKRTPGNGADSDRVH